MLGLRKTVLHGFNTAAVDYGDEAKEHMRCFELVLLCEVCPGSNYRWSGGWKIRSARDGVDSHIEQSRIITDGRGGSQYFMEPFVRLLAVFRLRGENRPQHSTQLSDGGDTHRLTAGATHDTVTFPRWMSAIGVKR